MPATILTTDHYDGVRALIAPDVTAAHISDAYLSEQAFAPDAERKVRKRLRAAKIDADTLTGESLEDARLAMMHECAATLCFTSAQLLRQTELEIVTEVQSIDWKAKRQFHLSESDALINDVIERAKDGVQQQHRSRALPFGAVGTERSDEPEPTRPYRRTYIDR